MRTNLQRRDTLQLHALPGFRANQPDAFGGGEPIVDGTLPVSLRAAGQVAFRDAHSLEVRSYVSIASPASSNPANCNGCAVHGVTVRPYAAGRLDRGRSVGVSRERRHQPAAEGATRNA